MRKFFALTLMTLSLVSFNSFAKNDGSLEDNMKEANNLFKLIGGSVTDASKNADNAQRAQQMIALFKLTKDQMPPHLEEMPEAKRAEAFKGYQEAIQHVIDVVGELEQAFLNNDNATAKKIYNDLKDLKQEGHDEYDP